MGVFFRRARQTDPPAASSGAAYRAASYAPLRPWQVRERRFRATTFGRSGLDPGEVHQFLDRIAGDLAAVYDQLARSREETMRVKDALRQWQSRQAQRMHDLKGS